MISNKILITEIFHSKQIKCKESFNLHFILNMDVLYKHRNNCYNISETNDKYVKQWVDNETTDTIINVAPYHIMPTMTYTRFNNETYQWCGPAMLYPEYLAKFTKSRLVFKL